jgi:hypothetical protein
MWFNVTLGHSAIRPASSNAKSLVTTNIKIDWIRIRIIDYSHETFYKLIDWWLLNGQPSKQYFIYIQDKNKFNNI